MSEQLLKTLRKSEASKLNTPNRYLKWLPENENVGRWHVEDLNSLSNIRKLEPVRGGGSASVR